MFLLHDPFDVLDDHNRVIDEQTNRQHHAQHRQRVDRKAKGREHAKGAQQYDRHRQRRDQGGADVLQEQIHHDEDQHDRLDQGLDHLFDRDFHEGRRIEGHDIAHPFGEERRQFLDPLFDGGGCIQRVGAGGKADRHAGRRIAIIPRDRGIAFRPDLYPRDIIQQHQPAVGFRAQHDLAEILWACQQRLRGDRGVQRLPFDGRTAAKGSRRNLGVLGRNRCHDVGRGQFKRGELHRIKPDAHRVLRPEHLYAAHAFDAADLVHQIGLHVIAKIGGVILPVLANQPDHHQEAGRGFLHRDPLPLHRFRQQRRGLRQFVLHLHLRDIDICAGLEGQRNARPAFAGGRRRNIAQPVQTGHLLFNHLRHRIGHRLRRGAGIGRAHSHRGRRDLRVLRHG